MLFQESRQLSPSPPVGGQPLVVFEYSRDREEVFRPCLDGGNAGEQRVRKGITDDADAKLVNDAGRRQ